MKEYFVEFKTGGRIFLEENYSEEQLHEEIDKLQTELRITDYDDYVLFNEEGEVVG